MDDRNDLNKGLLAWIGTAEVLRLLLTDPCPYCNQGHVIVEDIDGIEQDEQCMDCGGRGWTAKDGIGTFPGGNALVVPLSMMEEVDDK